MFTTPGHAAIWAKWIRDGANDSTAPWRYLLRGYDAVVDFPHVLFAREISEACPGAAVVLTKRGNSEEWVRSMEHLLETGGMIKKYRSILWWISRFSEEFITITDYINAWAFPNGLDREALRCAYETHNAVMESTSSVVTMNPSWGELTSILGMEGHDPLTPYPRLNGKSSVLKRFVCTNILTCLTLWYVLPVTLAWLLFSLLF